MRMKGVHKNFDVKKVKEYIVNWIKEWFYQNGKDCTAVVGISGGLDSTVVAALCVEALGKERVLGVLMPCGEQKDIQNSYDLCEYLKISYKTINIQDSIQALVKGFDFIMSSQARINLPARIRMSTLYAASQSFNGRVANTCNLSEDWIGYSTRYGDAAGDFSPLSDLTKTEVRLLAKELGLPEHLVEAVPSDGLCGKTDEENFGFTYELLDEYIRTGYCEDEKIKNKIDKLHEKNLFKLRYMDCCLCIQDILVKKMIEIFKV